MEIKLDNLELGMDLNEAIRVLGQPVLENHNQDGSAAFQFDAELEGVVVVFNSAKKVMEIQRGTRLQVDDEIFTVGDAVGQMKNVLGPPLLPYPDLSDPKPTFCIELFQFEDATLRVRVTVDRTTVESFNLSIPNFRTGPYSHTVYHESLFTSDEGNSNV